MAVKFVSDGNEEKKSVSQAVGDFFLARKKILLSVLIAAVVILVAAVVVIGVGQRRRKNAYERIYLLMDEWGSIASDSGESAREGEIIAELQSIADANKRNYAGVRSAMSVAEIYFSKKDWAEAKEWYAAAADAPARFYTTGLCLYNAGICSDEMNMPDEAIDFFSRAIKLDSFTQKPRAQFNIARIQEQNSRIEDAIASYRLMVDLYPESEWTDLAHSRIIALEIPVEN